MIAIIAAPVYGGIDRGPVRSVSMKSDPEFYPGGVWRDRPDALVGAFRRHGAHPKGARTRPTTPSAGRRSLPCPAEGRYVSSRESAAGVVTLGH